MSLRSSFSSSLTMSASMSTQNFIIGFIVSMALGLNVGTQARAQESMLLRYQFQPGQVLNYESVMIDKYRIQQNERVDEPQSQQTTLKSFAVKSVEPDGSAQIEFSMKRIQVELNEGGTTRSFDTAQPIEPIVDPAHRSLMTIVSNPPYMTFRITPRGEMSGMASQVLGDSVSGENTVASALEFLCMLPDYEVKVGDRWKEDFTINLPLEDNPKLTRVVKLQRQYHFLEFQAPLATIEVKTKVITPARDPDDEMLVQTIRRTPSGTIVLNTQTGEMVKKDLKQENEITKASIAFTMRFNQELRETLSK